MNNLMLDIETWDQIPSSAILAIAGVYFNPITGDTGKGLHMIITEDSCVDAGLSFGEETMEWWRNQDEEVKSFYKNHRKITLSQALGVFTKFLGDEPEKIHLWGNGSDFDNVILANAYRAIGQEPPWKYWNNRCVRTVYHIGKIYGYDAKRDTEFIGDKHNALDDCHFQAKYVSKVFQLMLRAQ